MQLSDVAVSNEQEPSAPGLMQHFSAVRRRYKPMALAFGLVFGAAALAAALWPPTFRSTGTILIEQQEIPTDFVRAAVSSYADQRVQMISQRVMTSANLIGIVDRYKLYPRDRDTATRETLVDRMRDDIKLEMISADVVDPRQGKATKATIAFSVSFDSRSPAMAARVANELTTLFLSENIETRKQLAADTASFLKEESERLGRRINELESKVAAFKTENSSTLPEYAQLNMQMIDRGQQELATIQTRMQSIDQQLVFLDAQMAQLSPTAPSFSDTGERVLAPAERLKMLQGQLAAAESRYYPEHPDVIRLTRELASLKAQLGATAAATGAAANAPPAAIDAANDIARQLEAARSQLAAAHQSYSEDHPDVQRLQRQVNSLQLALKQLPRQAAAQPTSRPATAMSDQSADNPTYIQIRAQREAAINERSALSAQLPMVRARVAEIERRRLVAPEIEKNYSVLQRDLSGEQLKYNEVRQKLLEAQLAQNLETERKGERFTLIEPPLAPQKPVEPNRPAIMLLGFVFAAASALGLMVLLETLDTRIRDRRHLLALLKVPPLAVIPLQELDEERAARRRRRLNGAMASAAGLAAALLAVHLFVRRLDLLWYTLLQRFGA